MAIALMMVKDFLSQKEMAAIGSVVAESAQFERSLDRFIMNITRLNRAQYDVLVGTRMLGAKIAIFKELGMAKLRSKKRQRQFTQIMDDFTQLNAERVVAVHGMWGPTGGVTNELIDAIFTGRINQSQMPPAVVIHRKGRGRYFKMEAKSLDEIAQGFSDGIHELAKFWDPKMYKRTEQAVEAQSAARKANSGA